MLEWEFGGLPSWLLAGGPTGAVSLRNSNKEFLYYVDRYFNKLFQLLEPLMYSNGGPIIAMQVYFLFVFAFILS